jgi:hypothetical protein
MLDPVLVATVYLISFIFQQTLQPRRSLFWCESVNLYSRIFPLFLIIYPGYETHRNTVSRDFSIVAGDLLSQERVNLAIA